MRYVPVLLALALATACSDQPVPSGNDGDAPIPAPQDEAGPYRPDATPSNAAIVETGAGHSSLAEAQSGPDSAQAAATVVETFYALVEAGKLDQAHALLNGAPGIDLRKRFGDDIEVHAEVLAPGGIEGAAGSLYVEVPVREYGMRKSGGAFSRPGKVVLKRVNDVPGSTADQRRWHIYRLDFKQ